MDANPHPIDPTDRRDLGLLRQAVVEWHLPPEAMEGMGAIMWDIVRGDPDPRTKVAAGRVMLGMSKVNIDSRKSQVAAPTVNVNILSAESLRQLPTADIDRMIRELEAEGGGQGAGVDAGQPEAPSGSDGVAMVPPRVEWAS